MMMMMPPERSVLSHAASAWWGFTTADDRQPLETIIRRPIRNSGFCSADAVSFVRAMEATDDHLFMSPKNSWTLCRFFKMGTCLTARNTSPVLPRMFRRQIWSSFYRSNDWYVIIMDPLETFDLFKVTQNH